MKSVIHSTLISSFVALTLGTATLLTPATASASDQRFTEYADVINVSPVYQDIRVRQPRKECWLETRQEIVGYQQPRYEKHQAFRYEEQGQRSEQSRSSNSGGAVVGGLIGGVIGNQLGRGHSSKSRTGATIAGAIIGGAIGNEARGDVKRHRNEVRRQRREQAPVPQVPSRQKRTPIYETVETERCKEVSESQLEQRLQHYDVTYRYKGRTFTTRTKRDPGRQIELQVSVAPVRN